MKRLFIGIMVLAMALSLAGGAWSASAPPKTICLQLTGQSSFKIFLVVKSVGTIKTGAGPVKYYTLAGEYFGPSPYSLPVIGTGHVNGTNFHFFVTGTYILAVDNLVHTIDITSNGLPLSTLTGPVRMREVYGSDYVDRLFDVEPSSSNFIIPFNAEPSMVDQGQSSLLPPK